MTKPPTTPQIGGPVQWRRPNEAEPPLIVEVVSEHANGFWRVILDSGHEMMIEQRDGVWIQGPI